MLVIRFSLIIGVLWWMATSSASAQQYPVQVTTLLTPPYSLFLSDYSSPERAALQLIVHLKELDRAEYKVKLRLQIEGQGISLRTKANYLPPPLVLQGGVPEMITGDQIRGYLHPDNLEFTGISKQQFLKTGKFPEGFYTFSVQVLDYFREVVVSNNGQANAWIILNDPPLINLPFNNEKLIATEPQNIIFSWTPRHTASPNAAFSTEYLFQLLELYPADRNPNDAFLSANTIYETTTNFTSLNYGVGEPLLIPGRRYAFRIRAYDTDGRDYFKNDGYSEVFSFQFGDACQPLTQINAQPLDDKRFKITWEGADQHTAFRYQYRQKGKTDWFSGQPTQLPSSIVPELLPNTTYEYQVRGQCQTLFSEWSQTGEVTTREEDLTKTACNSPVQPGSPIMNRTPINRLLKPGDNISSSAFDVTLIEVTKNPDGTYKGTGFGVMPVLANGASLRVKFSKIRVNDQYQHIEGSITSWYSTDSRFVVSLDATKKDLEKEKEEYEKQEQESLPEEVVFNGDIKEVVVNTDQIVITKEDGTQVTINRPKNSEDQYKEVKITDSQGDSWVVDKNGNVKQGPSTAAPETVASAAEITYTVSFAADPAQQYGFDKKETLTADYDQIELNGKSYDVAWKSVAIGRQEQLLAQTEQNSFPATIGFKQGDQTAAIEQSGSNSRKLFITGAPQEGVQQLKAYVRVKKDSTEQNQEQEQEQEVEVGRLNVKTYEPVWNKLYLVPVNGPQLPSIAELNESLNAIYKQAVAQWSVELKPEFTVSEEMLEGLDAGSKEMLASYPPKMLSLMRTYRNDPSVFVDQQAYYLFVVNRQGTELDGYMPLKRRVGFIFAEGLTTEALKRTIAHEVGHGAFGLRHTFSEEDFRAAEATTDNLMDYNAGTKLKKYQWDQIHEPPGINSWWEGDEEGAMVAAKKPKPVVIISDNTMTEGKVYVHSTTSSQMKVKFETSDTTKTKIAYQLNILVESTKTTILYPKSGYDTLVHNQVKEITLDSIPQGKYTLICKAAKTDYTLNFFIRKQKLEITKEQLKMIFPNTDDKRIEEVVQFINANSSAYDISTPERMAHFLGQIGAETGGLKKLKESPLYSPRTVVEVFPYPKYGHLFENTSLDSTTYNYSYRLINYDESKCNEEEMTRGTTVFPYSNSSEIVNAYAATKSDTLEVTLSGKKTKVLVYKKRTDVTKDNIKQKVTDDDYNSGLLKVKSKYIRSAALFDVTYGCRMGNGSVASKNGSTYLGKGFIHITGKGGYKEVSDEWNKLYPNDKKEFHGKDISLLETDVEVAIKASMVYWKIKRLNREADKGTDEDTIDGIGKIVNGSGKSLPNGWPERRAYTSKAVESLND